MDNSIGYDKTMTGGGPEHRQTLTDGSSFGQYRIVRLLGRGGMGEVYKAEHTMLGKSYALKLLPPEFSTSYDAVERFKREAKVMAQLEHPNIIRVDESGIVDGIYWLRMELAQKFELDGKTCQSLADLVAANGNRLPSEDLVPMLRQILSGLALAHSRGVVHRDLKPANILLSVNDPSTFRGWEDIRVKISDFGLARLVGEEWLRGRVEASVRASMSIGMQATQDGSPSSNKTSSRALLGTFEYMSPEQKRGEEADARSDVYAIGVMSYRLVTGRQMSPKSPSKLVKGLDPAWDDFIEKAMEEEAKDRYRDAGEMLAALERLAAEAQQRHQAAIVAEQARLAQEAEAKRQTELAEASRIKIPEGCRAAAGTVREPYTNTGWAREVVHEATGIELVYVPAGSFMMGSPKDEPGRFQNELQHRVTISQGFYLGKTEVTQGQWAKLMRLGLKDQVRLALQDNTVYNFGTKKCTFRDSVNLRADADPALLFGNEAADLPMYYVNWNECVAFCARAGAGLRLPTEAEWEYACRAGTRTALCEGDMQILGKYNAPALDPVAWYGGNSSVGYTGIGWKTLDWNEKQYPGGDAGPRVVGTRQPNSWGLYDMRGNVREWCQDCSGDYPAGEVTDPTGPATSVYRVHRGGSWRGKASSCRAADRDWIEPSLRSSDLGFRVTLSPAVR